MTVPYTFANATSPIQLSELDANFAAFSNAAGSISYTQGTNIQAGNFIVGNSYTITIVGNTSWTSIGASNNNLGTTFTATGAGSGTGYAVLERTVQSKLQDFVSVKDFGALGNSTYNSSTDTWTGNDDTFAFQQALNTGLPIWIPSGNYLITSELITTNSLVIWGMGPDESVIISACSGYTIRGQFTIDMNSFAIQGHKNTQANATAYGWDSYNAASHNWRIRNMRFQYLIQAMRFSESWIGQAYDIYVNDCGTSSVYSISLENATNEVTFNNLQIRQAMGGIGPGPSGQWAGKGLYAGNGTAPGGGSGSTCYDVNFFNLGLEHFGVQDAATFDSKVTIHGGYWENTNYPGSYNQVTFNDKAILIGGFWNAVVNIPSTNFQVTAIGSQWAVAPPGNVNNIGTGSGRGSTALSSTSGSVATFLPVQQIGSAYNAKISGPGNFQNLNNIYGLDEYYYGAYTLALVSDGFYNTQSLQMTNVNSTDFGGAVGLPFQFNPTTRNDVYGWAVMKCSTTDQIVLSLGGPNSEAPGNTIFFRGVPNQWYFVWVGSVNPYDSHLWARMYGSSGGAPSTGAILTIDSWGVSFGGLNLANIYADFTTDSSNIKNDRYRDMITSAIYSAITVGGGCNSSGPATTFSTINLPNGTAAKFATSSSGTPSGFSSITDTFGYFPSLTVDCSGLLTIYWATSIPSFYTRVYINQYATLTGY